MKSLKKVLIGTCIISMLVTPTSIFAAINQENIQQTSSKNYNTVLQPYEVYEKYVVVNDNENITSAVAALNGPPAGEIMFQLLDSNRNTIASSSQFGRYCFLDFEPLPKGSYILWVMNGNPKDEMHIYDMWLNK